MSAAPTSIHTDIRRGPAFPPDIRRPTTIERAIIDCQEAIANDHVAVIPTNHLMLEMLTLLAKLKHA
jgi:hypothetical protein